MGGGGNPIKSITNSVKNTLKNPMSLINPVASVSTGSVTGIPGVGPQTDARGGLLGAISGQGAAMDALAAQQAGMESANAALAGTFGQQQAYLNPYADAGKSALGNLTGDATKLMQNDPGYQFRLGEGNRAINASMAARGLGNSGAALKALTRYGQDYASSEYNNAFNRQSQIAGMGQNAANNLSSAAGAYGSNLANNYIGMGNANAAAQMQNHNNTMGLINTGLQAAALFSDERLKENVKPVDPKDLEEMQSHLRALAFNYINDKHGKGEWVGVMAQDLEKSKLGRTLVITDENGNKTIDQNKVLSMFLATLAKAA